MSNVRLMGILGATLRSRCFRFLLAGVAAIAGLGRSAAAEARPFEFTSLVAHWDEYGKPEYLSFIEEARPDVAQVGFYGAHFWSLAHTPQYGGYPAHFPVRGLTELGDWFEELNRQLHRRGVKVVGHFNVEFLVGDPDGPEGPRGFFKFYRDLWDEGRLGPKPVSDPLQLLERNADGHPITNRSYSIGGMTEYWACLRNPAWQQVLKAWMREGVRRGVDGFIANYFYRHNCRCEHCARAFRKYLRDRFAVAELRTRFGIDDLARHQFSELVSWHPPAETTPLRLEMLRFSQISNKEVFDEVFVRYGRTLKPGLMVAQWNHLGDFSQIDGDERCLLPSEIWGRDEDYLWYSTGDAANRTDLKNRRLGEATLQARYIRSAFRDRPFTLGKYEGTRIRTAIAELAANGGAPMGFYTRFTDPAARAEIIRYYRFLRAHDAIFRGNQPAGEVLLLYPRRAIHRGDTGVVQAFRELGSVLLENHVLFDVWPDDEVNSASASAVPRRPGPYLAEVNSSQTPSEVLSRLPTHRTRVTAPFSVRVSASRPAGRTNELDLHLVNYDRIEPAIGPDGRPGVGGGIRDERPVAAAGIDISWPLPLGQALEAVEFLTPESEAPQRLPAAVEKGRVRFQVPQFLVYGVVRILLRGGQPVGPPEAR